MTRKRLLLVLVLAALTAVLANRVTAQQVSEAWLGSPPPMKSIALNELIARAQYIFRGTVSVGIGSPASRPGLDFLKLSITVTHDLKRNIKDRSKPLIVYQNPGFSSPVEERDDVLWFLAEPSPTSGFSAPLGFTSGHFRVVPDPEHAGELLVENLRHNTELWSPSLLDRIVTKARLIDELKKMGHPDTDRFLALATNNCPSIPIPYDLITAVVTIRLHPVAKPQR